MTLVWRPGFYFDSGNRPAAIAGVAPTLDYRFARERREIEVVSLTDKLTYTGANGTFVGSDGFIQQATTNVPRFDHDPVTGESLGFLIEEARTNEILYSDDISNFWWNKASLVLITLVSSVSNPLENADTYRVRASTSSNNHYLYRNQADFLSDETDYTFSALVAPEGTGADSGKLQLRIFQILGNAGIVNFDLNTGQKNAQDGLSGTSLDGVDWLISDYGMEPYLNEWYRVWMTFRVTGSTCSIGIVNIDDIDASDASGIYSYAGSGTGGYYIAGIQVEEGTYKTSIIQTNGSTVTRAADSAIIDGTSVLTGTYTMIEKPASCAVESGGNIELQAGYTAERVMVFPAALSAQQITDIRSAM